MLLLFLVCSSFANELFLSDFDGARLRSVPISSSCSSSSIAIHVNSEEVFQEFDGVGGSFLRSGALSLSRLSKDIQDEVMEKLFSPTDGAGLSVGKIPIGACDYCPLTDAVNDTTWWGYWEDPKKSFSLGPDLQDPGGTIPYVKRAQRIMKEALWLQATMDYPPSWMLTDPSRTLPKANVDPLYYGELARYYRMFADEFEKASGFPLRYISLFNEPSDSYTYITGSEIADLLRKHVGPAFTNSSVGLTYASQADRNTTYHRTPEVMAIPGVKEYTSVLMYHGYDCSPWVCDHGNDTCPQLGWTSDLISRLHGQFPSLKLWMSEVCYAQEYGNWESPPCPALPFDSFQSALQWYRMLIADFRSGASAWIYWNMILNSKGGPHLTSIAHNDPVVDIQQPLVIVNAISNSYSLTGAYWALVHIGRFTPRSSRRVLSIGGLPNLPHVAFLRPDESIVVHFANDYAQARTVSVKWSSSCVEFIVPPISIASLIIVK